MKLISWNVNGLRACLTKGFLDTLQTLDADIVCLQETKAQPEQLDFPIPGYHAYWNSAQKKGYSGTAILTREEPQTITYDFGEDLHRQEGRVITAEYPQFFLVCCYTPNAQDGLKRLDYRLQWEDAFRAYLVSLDQTKPVILCGDLNVAHQEIDLKNPKTNRKNAGFSDEERGKFSQLLEAGFVDSFRVRYPDRADAYSWWSYRFQARQRNAGWRIDYFVLSQRLQDNIEDALIYDQILGSDHCPVGLLLREGTDECGM